MQRQTFINNMTERGYELCFVRNGSITATKGATDDETLRMIDGLAA